jgi:hypothetical protein
MDPDWPAETAAALYGDCRELAPWPALRSGCEPMTSAVP